MRTVGRLGLKRIELIVILALLALLSLSLIPLVQNAIWQSEASMCGERARDVYVALALINTARKSSAKPLFPDGRFTNSTTLFRFLLEQEPASGLAYPRLAGCGVPVCTDGKLKPENNMWTVIKEMRDEMDDSMPVMLTRNLDAASFSFKGTGKPLRFDPEWKTPFGNKGAVVIRKGGAIFMARRKYMTNRVLFSGGPLVASGPVRYLTPSREVVAGE